MACILPIIIWPDANSITTSCNLLQISAFDGTMVADRDLVLLASTAVGDRESPWATTWRWPLLGIALSFCDLRLN